MCRPPFLPVVLFLCLFALVAACRDSGPEAPDNETQAQPSATSPAANQRSATEQARNAKQKSREPEWKKLAAIFGLGGSEAPASEDRSRNVREVRDDTIPTASSPGFPRGQDSVISPAAPAAPPGGVRSQQQAAARPTGGPGGGAMPFGYPAPSTSPSTSGGVPGAPAQPVDPSSDRQPPAFGGASFNPPQAGDGEVATLTVTATDDLAGVRDISGVVTSPNGKAVIGFFCQPSNQPDVYAAQVTIPKNADRGNWYVGTLYLVDRANNGRNFSFNAGTSPARLLVVSSQSDSTPPALRSVRVEKPSVSEGEANRITVDAHDDASGIKSISGIFLSPTKSARIGFGGRPQGDGGLWSGDIVLPKGADCGTWALQQVEVLDGADNRAIFAANDPLVNGVSFLFVGNSCDSEPPVLQGLFLNPNEVDNDIDSEVTLTATVTDDKTGVAGVSGRVDGPPSTSGQRPSIYFSLSGNREDPSSPWVGRIRIAKFSAAGTWQLGSLQVIDRANNIKIYGPNDRQLAGSQFTVR